MESCIIWILFQFHYPIHHSLKYLSLQVTEDMCMKIRSLEFQDRKSVV